MKRALFFDLDDTIYPTKSVVDSMYHDLFELLRGGVNSDTFENIRKDILTTPFHVIADRYALDQKLKDEGLKMSLYMTYDGPMEPFEDYAFTRAIEMDKFLITAGYVPLQKSKIKQLGIAEDFNEIFIPDPYRSTLTKTDLFEQIMRKYNYAPDEILVIGDNPETELAAAKTLCIETYLYDYEGKYSPALANYYGKCYDNLRDILI